MSTRSILSLAISPSFILGDEGIISLRITVEIPSARPAPVPTTAIKSVPRTTPPKSGGSDSVTKRVRAVLGTIPGWVALI